MLRALSRIVDPDFGMDIVACGFVKDMRIDGGSGAVSFRLELTTPACPIKDEFECKVGTEDQSIQSMAWYTGSLLCCKDKVDAL